MKQQTFSEIEYANRKRRTKREEFLESMEEIKRLLYIKFTINILNRFLVLLILAYV